MKYYGELKKGMKVILRNTICCSRVLDNEIATVTYVGSSGRYASVKADNCEKLEIGYDWAIAKTEHGYWGADGTYGYIKVINNSFLNNYIDIKEERY